MNKERRKRIFEVHTKLEEIMAEIEAIRDDEQEAYDNSLESVQNGERGQAMQDAIDNLESANSSIEDVLEYLEAASE